MLPAKGIPLRSYLKKGADHHCGRHNCQLSAQAERTGHYLFVSVQSCSSVGIKTGD